MDIKNKISSMTVEEKALLITGYNSMNTAEIERLDIPSRHMADGPHGVRAEEEDNCTSFPSLSTLASSWSKDNAFRYGKALGIDCNHNGVSMILGPGANIKRTPLCGRNFEYMSEDPVLSGEMAAGYINGLQSQNVGACIKHFAANNQEVNRLDTSVNVDERTLREIYLRGFEIAVKKSNPAAVMCSYNKINSIWSSENPFLFREVLKGEWGYEGMTVSDWGAAHDVSKCLAAGLDLQMPQNTGVVEAVKNGLDSGKITMEQLDDAVSRVLHFVEKFSAHDVKYDRDEQHKSAVKIAEDCVVLLKNSRNALPLSKERHKKIAVVGEFAASPIINGLGSANVLTDPSYISSPVDAIRKAMPDSEVTYLEYYKKGEFPKIPIFTLTTEFRSKIREMDTVILFIGDMESEDTENFDKRTIRINPHYEMFIDSACKVAKEVIVVIQSGGAVILDEYCTKRVDALLYMGLGGEGAGEAIANVLCGNANPGGKLAETFPKKERSDLNYPGDITHVDYTEGLYVGYRYYDKHPEEIAFPFGHGLSYTTFEYSNIEAKFEGEDLKIDFDLKNSGDVDGDEVYQIYIGDPYSTLDRPIKELKYFDRVTLRVGEEKHISASIPAADLGQYNIMLHKWITESGRFDVLVGSSSQDIRLTSKAKYKCEMPYSINVRSEGMIG